MDLQLGGRVVLVVGGNGYIGSAIASRLVDEGATVIVASRSGKAGIVLDAADDESVTQAITAVLAEHRRLDAVVVTAAPSAQALDASRNDDPDQVADAVAAKALTFLRLANAVIPAMKSAGYGRIIGISGQNGRLTGNITGSVRNAALNIIAKNLADELAGSGVTVNTVNPGTVSDTPATDVQPGRGGESSPSQIADLVAFLASPLSALSGESIAIGHRLRGVV